MTTLTQSSIEEAFKTDEALQQTAAQTAKDITSGNYDIAVFVEKLGFALTSSNVAERASGTALLSATLGQLPKDYLTAVQLEFLTKFYADRMKDHHSVIPAVIDGLDALITMPNLPRPSIATLLVSFFQNISCQSQMRSDRAKLFKIFKYLSEEYATELKAMAGDFMYDLINAIDGERDPRNLDFLFSFMPDFIASFPLLHLSEEMFEVFACYFPIDFHPAKTDPATITRDNLAEKLTNCLVASPEFVDWAVALALEKLDSELVVAKLDALELLKQAALKFPPKSVEVHFEAIWTALKADIFPGSGNSDVLAAGLAALRALLESAASMPDVSHNYQTAVLGAILPHLGDVNQRLFQPSAAVALVCVAGDAPFASDKILHTFLLRLCPPTDAGGNDGGGDADMAPASAAYNDDQRQQVYTIVAQICKIASLRQPLEQQLAPDVCAALHKDVLAALRRGYEGAPVNLDLTRSALCLLGESVPVLDEPGRALLYKALVQLITHDTVDLEFTALVERLGALHPVELQAHCIDVCIRNFALYASFVKRKIYANLLPLLQQLAFTDRVLDLVLTYALRRDRVSNEERLLALQAFTTLLQREDARFVAELQHENNLIEQVIQLARAPASPVSPPLSSDNLQEVASALSWIVQRLAVAEQYAIATEYLPQLNLQTAADLYVAKGLLGFLHADISLDDHFERLLDDLTQLSLTSGADESLRQIAHHLLCSLLNKIDYTPANRAVVRALIAKLRAEIARGTAPAVEALAWLGKALVVRGAEDAGEIVEALAQLLDHPTLSAAAALAFQIIATEYPQLHLPLVKFLYKQKFFHMVLAHLGQRLAANCAQHLNAFIYVLQTTPHAVLRMNIEKIGPILFRSLESENKQTSRISLEICEHFIQQQDDYFRAHLNHIIPSCLQLATFPDSMHVRIQALQVLNDITRYPTFVLLPYKMDVVLALLPVLDDAKRLVRTAAVTARNSWFLVGAATMND